LAKYWFLFQARDLISQEHEKVKEIHETLASFKSNNPKPSYAADNDYGGSPFPDYARHEEPTRDPDVWPPPTPVEYRYVEILVGYNFDVSQPKCHDPTGAFFVIFCKKKKMVSLQHK